MGRLLQKFLHGIVPSWLTRIKASDSSSHRKKLPFFKGSINVFSSKRKTSARSPLLAITNEPTEKAKDPHREEDDRAGHDLEQLLKRSPEHTSLPKPLPDEDIQEDQESELQNSESIDGLVQENESKGSDKDEKEMDTSSCPREANVQEGINGDHDKFIDSGEMDTSSCPGEANVQEGINGDHDKFLDSAEMDTSTCPGETIVQERINGDRDQFLDSAEKEEEGKITTSGEGSKNFTVLHKHKETCKRKRENEGCSYYHDLDQNRGDEDEDEDEGEGWSSKRHRDMSSQGLTSCELPEYVSAIVGNAEAVVKFSEDPGHAFWESMVDMIVENGLWEIGNLEILLECYLALNDGALHDTIVNTFLQVIHDILLTVEVKDKRKRMKLQDLFAMA